MITRSKRKQNIVFRDTHKASDSPPESDSSEEEEQETPSSQSQNHPPLEKGDKPHLARVERKQQRGEIKFTYRNPTAQEARWFQARRKRIIQRPKSEAFLEMMRRKRREGLRNKSYLSEEERREEEEYRYPYPHLKVIEQQIGREAYDNLVRNRDLDAHNKLIADNNYWKVEYNKIPIPSEYVMSWNYWRDIGKESLISIKILAARNISFEENYAHLQNYFKKQKTEIRTRGDKQRNIKKVFINKESKGGRANHGGQFGRTKNQSESNLNEGQSVSLAPRRLKTAAERWEEKQFKKIKNKVINKRFKDQVREKIANSSETSFVKRLMQSYEIHDISIEVSLETKNLKTFTWVPQNLRCLEAQNFRERFSQVSKFRRQEFQRMYKQLPRQKVLEKTKRAISSICSRLKISKYWSTEQKVFRECQDILSQDFPMFSDLNQTEINLYYYQDLQTDVQVFFGMYQDSIKSLQFVQDDNREEGRRRGPKKRIDSKGIKKNYDFFMRTMKGTLKRQRQIDRAQKQYIIPVTRVIPKDKSARELASNSIFDYPSPPELRACTKDLEMVYREANFLNHWIRAESKRIKEGQRQRYQRNTFHKDHFEFIFQEETLKPSMDLNYQYQTEDTLVEKLLDGDYCFRDGYDPSYQHQIIEWKREQEDEDGESRAVRKYYERNRSVYEVIENRLKERGRGREDTSRDQPKEVESWLIFENSRGIRDDIRFIVSKQMLTLQSLGFDREQKSQFYKEEITELARNHLTTFRMDYQLISSIQSVTWYSLLKIIVMYRDIHKQSFLENFYSSFCSIVGVPSQELDQEQFEGQLKMLMNYNYSYNESQGVINFSLQNENQNVNYSHFLPSSFFTDIKAKPFDQLDHRDKFFNNQFQGFPEIGQDSEEAEAGGEVQGVSRGQEMSNRRDARRRQKKEEPIMNFRQKVEVSLPKEGMMNIKGRSRQTSSAPLNYFLMKQKELFQIFQDQTEMDLAERRTGSNPQHQNSFDIENSREQGERKESLAAYFEKSTKEDVVGRKKGAEKIHSWKNFKAANGYEEYQYQKARFEEDEADDLGTSHISYNSFRVSSNESQSNSIWRRELAQRDKLFIEENFYGRAEVGAFLMKRLRSQQVFRKDLKHSYNKKGTRNVKENLFWVPVLNREFERITGDVILDEEMEIRGVTLVEELKEYLPSKCEGIKKSVIGEIKEEVEESLSEEEEFLSEEHLIELESKSTFKQVSRYSSSQEANSNGYQQLELEQDMGLSSNLFKNPSHSERSQQSQQSQHSQLSQVSHRSNHYQPENQQPNYNQLSSESPYTKESSQPPQLVRNQNNSQSQLITSQEGNQQMPRYSRQQFVEIFQKFLKLRQRRSNRPQPAPTSQVHNTSIDDLSIQNLVDQSLTHIQFGGEKYFLYNLNHSLETLSRLIQRITYMEGNDYARIIRIFSDVIINICPPDLWDEVRLKLQDFKEKRLYEWNLSTPENEGLMDQFKRSGAKELECAITNNQKLEEKYKYIANLHREYELFRCLELDEDGVLSINRGILEYEQYQYFLRETQANFKAERDIQSQERDIIKIEEELKKLRDNARYLNHDQFMIKKDRVIENKIDSIKEAIEFSNSSASVSLVQICVQDYGAQTSEDVASMCSRFGVTPGAAFSYCSDFAGRYQKEYEAYQAERGKLWLIEKRNKTLSLLFSAYFNTLKTLQQVRILMRKRLESIYGKKGVERHAEKWRIVQYQTNEEWERFTSVFEKYYRFSYLSDQLRSLGEERQRLISEIREKGLQKKLNDVERLARNRNQVTVKRPQKMELRIDEVKEFLERRRRRKSLWSLRELID